MKIQNLKLKGESNLFKLFDHKENSSPATNYHPTKSSRITWHI